MYLAVMQDKSQIRAKVGGLFGAGSIMHKLSESLLK